MLTARAASRLGVVGVLCAAAAGYDDERGRRAAAEYLQAGHAAAKHLGEPAPRIAQSLFGASKLYFDERNELERELKGEGSRAFMLAHHTAAGRARERANADVAELCAGIAGFELPKALNRYRWLSPWTRSRLCEAIEDEPNALVGLRAICCKYPGAPAAWLNEIRARNRFAGTALSGLYASTFLFVCALL